MSEARRAYDPIGDLAELIDGLLAVAAAGTGPDHHYHSGLVSALADLLAGPYARLRGGLLLRENQGWMERQQALADAVRGVRDPAELHMVLSTVLSRQDYAELGYLLDTEPGQDPRS
jgi:hypothetical protein